MGPSKVARSWIAAVALLVKPVEGHAQVARVEIHTFASTTLTDQEFLSGQKEGRPVVLAGELRIPKPGVDRLPAVVLAHGSGGISGNVDDWALKLNALGVATFVFDSFTPRGIVTANEDQSQLGRLAMVMDSYRAFSLLAQHPRVDPQRIALLGFSRGGQATLYASLKRFQRMHSVPGTGFAMFIAFYPDCATRYLQDDDVVNRPIRVFQGSDDDANPVAPCRAYVERLQKAGRDAGLTEYSGAHHVFDGVAFKVPTKFPKVQTVRRCRIEEVSEGRLVNSETKQPFTYTDGCVERGVTMAYNAQAHGAAVSAVTALVNSVLKGK